MLLDRTRPSEDQGFGDYLNDLGKKNGFINIRKFKIFLMNSADKKYYVYCSYSSFVKVIVGLFIELGIDKIGSPDCAKPLCFGCLNTLPVNWALITASESRCRKVISFWNGCLLPGYEVSGDREEFCGLMKYSVSRLGLNFSPKKEGLYYADQFSKNERDENNILKIYPDYKAFMLV